MSSSVWYARAPWHGLRTMAVAAVLAVTASFPSYGTNQSYWDLWALQVGMICFAQNPAYRTTPLGELVSKGDRFESWAQFDRQPMVACFRSNQWISDRLCADVTSLDANTFRNLSPLHRKHVLELEGLRDMLAANWRSRDECPDPKKRPARIDLPPTERNEAKASEYAFCAQVAYATPYAASSAVLGSRNRENPAQESAETAKNYAAMQIHFMALAQQKSDSPFVENELRKSTERLNELRRKEAPGSYALLRQEEDRCRAVWINEVRPLFERRVK